MRFDRCGAEDARTTVEMTEAGTTRFAEVFASARAATDAATAGIEPAVLETAFTVLEDIEKRVVAILG